MCDSVQSSGLQPAWLLCPWVSPGKNTGSQSGQEYWSGFQVIFLTQGLNPCLLRLLKCRQILYQRASGEAYLIYSPQIWKLPNSNVICPYDLFSSVQSLSRVRLFATSWIEHDRPPCQSPAPGVYSNSCPSSRWCHPAISSSVVPFSSCPLSLPASGSFPMSQLFTWGGQSTGVSASASVLPMNTQDWSPLGWTGWISLQSKGLSRVFSNTTVQKHQFLTLSFLHSPTLTSIRDHWKKIIALTRWTFVVKVMSLLFNTLSRLVITFLPRSKRLLSSSVIWEPKK